jgi:DNA polymerase-3 subunit epsilon
LAGRTKHGALIDCELLAKVYLELLGGRQTAFTFGGAQIHTKVTTKDDLKNILRSFKEPRPHQPTTEELTAHKELIERIKNNLWKN